MRIREVFRKHRLTEEELLSLDADGIMDALDYDEELEGITNTVQNIIVAITIVLSILGIVSPFFHIWIGILPIMMEVLIIICCAIWKPECMVSTNYNNSKYKTSLLSYYGYWGRTYNFLSSIEETDRKAYGNMAPIDFYKRIGIDLISVCDRYDNKDYYGKSGQKHYRRGMGYALKAIIRVWSTLKKIPSRLTPEQMESLSRNLDIAQLMKESEAEFSKVDDSIDDGVDHTIDSMSNYIDNLEHAKALRDNALLTSSEYNRIKDSVASIHAKSEELRKTLSKNVDQNQKVS